MTLNNNLPLNLWKVLAKFGGVSLSITDALLDDSGKSPGGGEIDRRDQMA